MSITDYDAIFFDFDGVLVESLDIKERAFADIYGEYGDSVVNSVLAHHRAQGGISRLEKFRFSHRQFLGRELDQAGLNALGERFRAFVEDEVAACGWVPGAREFLERYAEFYPLFVISGTPDDELHRIVERRRMRHYFISVHGSPAGKPEILHGLLLRHGFRAGRTLMVGDAATDYEAARACGTAFVGRVPPGRENPFPAGTAVIADLCGLSPDELCGP